MEQTRGRQTPSDEALARVPRTLPGESAPRVSDLITLLGSVQLGTESDELIDQISDLETLKSAIGALQARASVAFNLAQRREQEAAGIPRPNAARVLGPR